MDEDLQLWTVRAFDDAADRVTLPSRERWIPAARGPSRRDFPIFAVVVAGLVLLGIALWAAVPGRIDVGAPASVGDKAQQPMPSATAAAANGCDATGNYSTPVVAQYPTRNLRTPQEQQDLVRQGVGTDMGNVRIAAIAYLTDVGVLSGSALTGYLIQPTGPHEATVVLCRSDGPRFRISLAQPFPNEPRPIWTVGSYQQGDR
jgi:hypothetical protein